MSSLQDETVPLIIVGAGVIGRKHAIAIQDSPHASLVAVIDPTPTGKVLADELGTQSFLSIAEFFKSGLDARGAIICTPNATHVSIGMELASSGLHLLVEKPLSSDAAEGETLLVHSTKQGVRVCVGHHRRQNPRIAAAKAALRRGAIGRVLGCSGVWVTLKTDDYFEGIGTWRRNKSGGVVLINVIHEVDMLQSLVGRIVRVFAEKAPSTRGFEAEEGAAITFKFENGAVGTFLALDNASSPFTFEQASAEFTYHPYSGQNTYMLFGSRGTLNVPQNELWTPTDLKLGWKSTLEKEVVPWTDGEAFQRQLQNFVGVIRGTAEPSCSGEDGLAAVAVCRAIQQSLADGRPIDI